MTIKKTKEKNSSNQWLELAKRGMLHDPLIRTALEQLSVNTQDNECYKIIEDAIYSYDVREILSPEPFRLSNPSHKHQVGGPIHLGVVSHTGAKWGLYSKALTRHLLTVGKTGAGKSNLIKHIIRQLLNENISIIVPDRKQDFFELAIKYDFLYLLHDDFYDNWLLPPEGVDPLLWHNILAEILAIHFELRIGAQGLIVEVLTELTNAISQFPTLHDVIKKLHKIAYVDKSYNKESALRLSFRLKWLLTVLGNNVASSKTPDWSILMKSSWAFSISGLASSIQTLCVTVYFAKVLLYRISNNLISDELECLFVLDEASVIFPKSASKKTSLLLDYFQQARAFGLGVIVASQSMNLAQEIYANTGIKVSFALGYGADFSEFASAVGLNKEKSDFMRTISKPGSAVVRDPRYPTPFTVQIERPHDE